MFVWIVVIHAAAAVVTAVFVNRLGTATLRVPEWEGAPTIFGIGGIVWPLQCTHPWWQLARILCLSIFYELLARVVAVIALNTINIWVHGCPEAQPRFNPSHEAFDRMPSVRCHFLRFSFKQGFIRTGPLFLFFQFCGVLVAVTVSFKSWILNMVLFLALLGLHLAGYRLIFGYSLELDMWAINRGAVKHCSRLQLYLRRLKNGVPDREIEIT